MAHVSVLKEETIKFLHPGENENFIDATCGAAGHSLEILKRNGPGGKVLCMDLDRAALEKAKEKISNEGFGGRAVFVNDNFSNLKKAVQENGFEKVSGVIADIGLSSDQLEASGRGFSFLNDEPLDMRFSIDRDLTAFEIINYWPEKELEEIFRNYGEERFAFKMAEKIVQIRKLKKIATTQDLVEAIGAAVPERFKHGRTHFATRIFQALRIAVNDELGNLEKLLSETVEILEPNGRIVVISFHSLEDRIVKNFFREKSRQNCLQVLTKKPVTSGEEELRQNPRARSAKLRAAKKI